MTYSDFVRKYPQHAEELEERAAIMEYHGDKDRQTAESKAVMRLRIKYELLFTQPELFGGAK